MVSSLPTEAVEWKRSYGRTSKSVYVEAEFHPIDVEALLKVSFNIEMHTPYNNKAREEFVVFFLIYWLFNIKAKRSLNGQQVLHTFWTDCSDIETYKVINIDKKFIITTLCELRDVFMVMQFALVWRSGRFFRSLVIIFFINLSFVQAKYKVFVKLILALVGIWF